MRILLPSQEYPPETGWGGIGTFLSVHAPALAGAGHEVHVLSCVQDQASSISERDGVTIHRRGLVADIRGGGRLAPQAWRRIRLARSVAAHRRSLGSFDVVEAPEWMAESLLLRGTPLVVHLHSGAAQLFGFIGRRGVDATIAVRIERQSIRRADLLIGSRMGLAGAPRGRRSPPAVEIPYPVRLLEPRAPWRDGAPRIVFVGRFEHRKGVDRLIEALPLVLAERGDAVLELVGRDTTRADGRSTLDLLRRRAHALGVDSALRVKQEWGRDAVERALAGAAACVVPSRWESFGYTAAEAVAGATPTIVSSWPSLVELVSGGRGGVVVDGDDPAAWAAAILAAVSDPVGALDKASRGRELLARRFSPGRIAARSTDAYERAIHRHGHRSGRWSGPSGSFGSADPG